MAAPFVMAGLMLGIVLGVLPRWRWRIGGLLVGLLSVLGAVAATPHDRLSASTWALIVGLVSGGVLVGFVPVAYARWLSHAARDAEDRFRGTLAMQRDASWKSPME